MRHIFIAGSRGYHEKYGGWETFVSKLVDNYNDNNTLFHVSMFTNNKNAKKYKKNNVIVDPIYVKSKGSIKMFIYTIRAYKYYLNYIKKEKIDSPYIYVLGLKLFNYLKLKRKTAKKLGIKVYVNPDGLEHKRSKWSYPVKKFFLISERLMLNNCDLVVCDGKGIEKYILNKYPKLKGKTTYIAYGYDKLNVNKDEVKVLNKYNIRKNAYILMVGRCVPENNYELVINEYMKSNIKKELLIITNLSSSDYINELKEKTHFDTDDRIRIIDGVYDNEELGIIRKNAFAYIHGHSVGGTNPSLIESLSLTDLNILYDVCFNRDVGEDSCLYFKNEGSLEKMLNDEKFLISKKSELGKKAKLIAKNNFTWEIIVNKYKKIFK